MDTGHVVLNLIALLIIISALSGLCGLFARSILARQHDQVRRRLIAPGLAYQRYIAGVSLLRLLVVVLIVVCVIISANVVLLNSITPADPFPATVRWYAAGLLPIVWVSLVIFSVSVETTTGSEALQLLGITATGRQILWFRLRTVLLSLPPLVLLESIAVLWLLNLPVWLLGIFVPLLLAVTLVSWSRRYRWLFRSRPIEETEWSALSPRIQAWARLAKFPYHKTRVTASQTIGFRDGNVGGLFHRTLYISDALLPQHRLAPARRIRGLSIRLEPAPTPDAHIQPGNVSWFSLGSSSRAGGDQLTRSRRARGSGDWRPRSGSAGSAVTTDSSAYLRAILSGE